jgi:hypothetical protein
MSAVADVLRQWTLAERTDGTWTVMAQHTGEIREHPIAQALLACIFGDLAVEPPVVAVAHWLAGEVDGMHTDLVAAEADQ